MYDVNIDKDMFMKTTRKIAEYVSRQYDDADEFRIGMVRFELVPLAEPMLPEDNAMVVELKLSEMAQRHYEKQREA
jgi:hypothetical protein